MTDDIIKDSINRFTSSIEIGTPSKGGAIKVYVDPANPAEAEERVTNMIQLRKFAETKIVEG